ncbi:glycosyl hydrolase family 28 protein [Paenibacillus sp. MMS20-IR301]|uniref:glycosyl hydrolase family 28 protein n=1 Tax=Paenibacillus sp. MMS20-IR301 TaxID=2895946 RepID=UPI0028EF2983|nr:glycosyl hydrolase family 28 protein [Paenibacillus sp. MMS20-IR301]WNS43912.1 glycosyl hydrolase family 28 protein [Paenibacillus sp. MMS20-IR301]
MNKKNLIQVYSAPEGAVRNSDFSVRVRTPEGGWEPLFSYNVKVDMHNVRDASMVQFNCAGTVIIEIEHHSAAVHEAVIRPLSAGLTGELSGRCIYFTIDGPKLLSVEINGDRFHNLHIFANPLEEPLPAACGSEIVVLEPGLHNTEELQQQLEQPADPDAMRTVVFSPGIHRLSHPQLHLPSCTTIYLPGGAVLYGGFVCNAVHDVAVKGNGILYMTEFEKNTFYRGFEIKYSRNIQLDGITVIDPPHYTVLLGQSEHILIRNLKSFSTRGWCDGIDMMACKGVTIEGGFLRTSDDCIAVYASRGEFRGDTREVSASGIILWADVAHPVNIGTHGDYDGEGDVIENISFTDIDILEHHEPQPDYWGCLAINAGDNNTVRNVVYEDIRIEAFELGELFNLRVLQNEKYNPVPGRRIEQVTFRNIHYNGTCLNPSHIEGYDHTRVVEHIVFENVTVNGSAFQLAEPNIIIGKHARNIMNKPLR